jgi:hypothetical protein
VVQRLFIAGLVGFLANGFRYAADVLHVSWKWGESVGFLIFGLVNLYAVWPLMRFGQKMSQTD